MRSEVTGVGLVDTRREEESEKRVIESETRKKGMKNERKKEDLLLTLLDRRSEASIRARDRQLFSLEVLSGLLELYDLGPRGRQRGLGTVAGLGLLELVFGGGGGGGGRGGWGLRKEEEKDRSFCFFLLKNKNRTFASVC